VERGGGIALQMVGITKAFPGVMANDNVHLEVRQGEIHALLGENGAGKSTLMKILYGLHHPDSGEIYLEGRRVDILSPRHAVDLGIGMVHQHFMLVPNLTVLENVVLGLRPTRPPLLDVATARERFLRIAEDYQIDIDPSAYVWQLPVGAQQWLEILKMLFREAKLLVLDEPTAVLAPSQVTQLFRILHKFTEEGRSVVFISHKLDEVQEVSDRITVLRDGRVTGTVNTTDVNSSKLAHMMVGRPVSLDRRPREDTSPLKQPILRLAGVSCENDRGLPALKNLNLTVNAGEIVGVAGVDGNGQRELAECVAGLRKLTSGEVTVAERRVDDVVKDPGLLGFIPEDRHATGLILDFTVAENLVLKTFWRAPFSRRGILDWATIRDHGASAILRFRIKAPGPTTRARQLSGGNQQKVVVAREVVEKPSLLIAAQPTRGLDIGAVEAVHEILLKERNRGAGVLFISTELSEVMAVSDRIIVMFKGEIMGEVDAEAATVTRIGEMMLGRRAETLAEVG